MKFERREIQNKMEIWIGVTDRWRIDRGEIIPNRHIKFAT